MLIILTAELGHTELNHKVHWLTTRLEHGKHTSRVMIHFPFHIPFLFF